MYLTPCFFFTKTSHTGSCCKNNILLIMSMTILHFAVTKE